MKQTTHSDFSRFITTTLLLLLASIPAHAHGQVERREEIRRTLTFTGETPRLLLDNLAGSVTVEGYDGKTVEMTVIRTTTGDDERRLNEANEDVILDVVEKGNRVEIVVDAPWRQRWGGWDNRDRDFYGYDVRFDFSMKVPRNVSLHLRTVEDGTIEVRGMAGRFDVRNVTGDIRMFDIAGHGRASAVNGSVEVSFATNPTDNCHFASVNGSVETTFDDGLDAKLVLKTFNGKAYTDFDVEAVEPETTVKTTKRGKRMYKVSDAYAVQVGRGGPTLSFDTLNGDIHIRRRR